MNFERMYDLMNELQSLDFGDYTVYYTECHHVPTLLSNKTNSLLVEKLVDKSALINNTDAKRLARGKDEVEILDYDIHTADPQKYGKGYKMLEYAALADPTSEHKVHHGYIVYFASNGKVTEVYCSCSDFFFRLYAPYVRAGLSTFNLDKKYRDYMMQTYGKPHNRQWTDKTNPNGELYLCKHLYKVMDEIMDTDNFVKKLLDTDEEDERIRRAINADEFGKNKEAEKEPPKKAAKPVKKAAPPPPEEEPEEPELEEPDIIEPDIEEPIDQEPIDEPIEDIPEEEPEPIQPPKKVQSDQEDEEFEDDLEDIEPAKDIKVNYPKEKKPAPPAKIGTGFGKPKNNDTV